MGHLWANRVNFATGDPLTAAPSFAARRVSWVTLWVTESERGGPGVSTETASDLAFYLVGLTGFEPATP